MKQKIKLKVVVICIFIFLFFILITFPVKNLSNYVFSTIYRNTGIVLVAEDMYLTLFGWPGLVFSGPSISIPLERMMGPQVNQVISLSEINLKCQKLVMRVGVRFVFPFPFIFSLKIVDMEKGGNIYVKFYNTEKTLGFFSNVKKLQLSQLNFPNDLNTVSGVFSAEADINWFFESPPQSKGYVDLSIEDILIPTLNFQGIILPSLNIERVFGSIYMQNGVIATNNLYIENKKLGLNGTVNGELRLAQNFIQSHLTLTIRFLLSEQMLKNPNYSAFISFLSAYEVRPGSYGLRWSSTLQDISTNLMYALPQKVTD